MPTVTNTDVPHDPARRKRRFHYVSYTVDADPETLAEEANKRASTGYRLAWMHFFGTANPQCTMVFERRLRAHRKPRQASPPPQQEPLRADEATGPVSADLASRQGSGDADARNSPSDDATGTGVGQPS